MLTARIAGALLIGLPTLALAASPACGVYRNADGSRELRIETTSTASEHTSYQAPRPLAFTQAGGTLTAYDLESAYSETWKPEDGGRTLRTEMGEIYTLAQSAQCATPPPAPASAPARIWPAASRPRPRPMSRP